MKKSIIFAIFLIGFTAMSAQIVLLRQLIAVFYGNEISLGIFLGAWLFWGALGSGLIGRLADKIKEQQFYFALLEIVLALALIAVLVVIKNARTLLHILPGEIIGFLPIAVFSFFTLSLICTILGFLFALACRIYPEKQEGAMRIGRVYLQEALGAVCGGMLLSFFLIRYFDGCYLILGLAGLNLISAFLLQKKLVQPRFILATKPLTLALIFLLLALFGTQKAKELKEALVNKQWKHFRVLASEDTIYSNLVVTQQNGQHSFFSNGLYLFTAPDAASSEEAVHFALLETPRAQRVLLIGAGMGGALEEILKHPVTKLDYVELDPQIVALGKRFLPLKQLSFLDDPRLNIFHQDGRLFIQQEKLTPNFIPYDSVIVYLAEPYTAQLNRFYTREFFRQVKQCLVKDGVFSFSVSSAENFLNQEQEQFLSSLYQTLTSVFSEVKIIPGDTAYFLATDTKGTLTTDYRRLLGRLSERSIQTKFVREYYLFAKLSAERIAYIEEKVKNKQARLNSDFQPISYYYDLVLWSSLFTRPWQKVFSLVNQKTLWVFFLGVSLLVLIWGICLRSKALAKSRMVLLAISTTGLTGLAFQVVILLTFQIIYGYLYYKLGMLLSFFMAGLALGAYLITTSHPENTDGLFIKTQAAIFIYPLILPPIFYFLNQFAASKTVNWLGANIVFPVIAIISGMLGGFQFTLANKIILKNQAAIGRIGGLTYGMDLIGSCLGALLVSTFLVPILGINQTCLVLALLNGTVLLNLWLVRPSCE